MVRVFNMCNSIITFKACRIGICNSYVQFLSRGTLEFLKGNLQLLIAERKEWAFSYQLRKAPAP